MSTWQSGTRQIDDPKVVRQFTTPNCQSIRADGGSGDGGSRTLAATAATAILTQAPPTKQLLTFFFCSCDSLLFTLTLFSLYHFPFSICPFLFSSSCSRQRETDDLPGIGRRNWFALTSAMCVWACVPVSVSESLNLCACDWNRVKAFFFCLFSGPLYSAFPFHSLLFFASLTDLVFSWKQWCAWYSICIDGKQEEQEEKENKKKKKAYLAGLQAPGKFQLSELILNVTTVVVFSFLLWRVRLLCDFPFSTFQTTTYSSCLANWPLHWKLKLMANRTSWVEQCLSGSSLCSHEREFYISQKKFARIFLPTHRCQKILWLDLSEKRKIL